MDKSEAIALIEAAGGDMAFAKLLGIEAEPGVAQRVNNWKRRGIPADVVLDNLSEIQKLQRELAEKTPSGRRRSVRVAVGA